ncbi:efflux RND transporter periplasmic adaptor subunit [Hydrogenophaga sp.]|jgi:cobalt-zinc-cadmium efflux system membrane fusion protein|uniref:efflux RND transporter periplasmic adaptor subunit n=1 Tax=Hydrogenophaga sp. TaxID=1904254 RepID=UPI00260A99A1|nr:efflux RND transporter periplasmic adaptor subunit [Hydrogenophaga sp.]
MNHSTLLITTSTVGVRLVLTAITTALALAMAGCGEGDKSALAAPPATAQGERKEEPGLKLSPEDTQRAGIKLETLAAQNLADTVTFTATIRPNADRVARVAPRVEGRIVQVSANLGDKVKAGQALAVLDSLALGEAHSTLQRAQAAHRVAQSEFKRAESLSADEIIPQREFLRAKAGFESATADLHAAEDKLRLLGGTASSARGGRESSTFALTAPLAGTVVQKDATVGELGSPAAALFSVADLSIVWIEANLTEDKLASVKTGAAATVTVTAYPGERFAGRVTYVASMLDKDSRTTPARIEVSNQDGRLKPEMFASATIETGGTRPPALSVPSGSIVLMQGQPTVFVVGKNGYDERAIVPGEKLSGRTVVSSGLMAGDQVVVEGAYALKARLLKSQIGDAN